MALIIQIVFFLFLLLVCGFIIGRYQERTHLKNLDEREANNDDMTITQLKDFPGGCDPAKTPKAITKEVVIGSDYLKRFLMTFKHILGGELTSYESLILRARREALQRIVEQARHEGYNAVCNVRMYMTYLGGSPSSNQKNMTIAEIMVVGTAYRTASEPDVPDPEANRRSTRPQNR